MEYFPKFVQEKSYLESIIINDSTINFEDDAENYERVSGIKHLDLSYNNIDSLPDKLKKISLME
jgi:hypothetical protein